MDGLVDHELEIEPLTSPAMQDLADKAFIFTMLQFRYEFGLSSLLERIYTQQMDTVLRKWASEVAKEISEQKSKFPGVHVQGYSSPADPNFVIKGLENLHMFREAALFNISTDI
ncbi:hypothetical protein KIN20_013828 [Parelaphostrongylus tenuis]|uniref:Uncharacterized protein n=1 Tax=Parelaphostrongylus tenuis TaxID=148309 RepID=A0AAD5ME39_PARTN|nr:hypothetical protein KIN20_013828 [Parelaphostrongylus tenuis]